MGRGTAGDRGGVELRGERGKRAAVLSVVKPGNLDDNRRQLRGLRGDHAAAAQNVGSKSTKGDGKWGQSDLAGNMWEWTLDWYANPYLISSCNNCADMTAASARAIRGGYFYGDASVLRSAVRSNGYPDAHSVGLGARCARTSL